VLGGVLVGVKGGRLRGVFFFFFGGWLVFFFFLLGGPGRVFFFGFCFLVGCGVFFCGVGLEGCVVFLFWGLTRLSDESRFPPLFTLLPRVLESVFVPDKNWLPAFFSFKILSFPSPFSHAPYSLPSLLIFLELRSIFLFLARKLFRKS